MTQKLDVFNNNKTLRRNFKFEIKNDDDDSSILNEQFMNGQLFENGHYKFNLLFSIHPIISANEQQVKALNSIKLPPFLHYISLF